MTSRRTRFIDWLDRRAARRVQKGPTSITARDIAGATGWVRSNAWDKIAEGSEAYAKSFDPRVPPSLHISHRDATRHNIPMPVPERCLEDFGPGAPTADDEPTASEDPAVDEPAHDAT